MIKHINKCFTFAIAQNKEKSKELASTLRAIPNPLYGHHENCGEWCKCQDDNALQTVKLKDLSLYNILSDIFNK